MVMFVKVEFRLRWLYIKVRGNNFCFLNFECKLIVGNYFLEIYIYMVKNMMYIMLEIKFEVVGGLNWYFL